MYLYDYTNCNAEFGQIINGERTGRETDQEITVFKSVGLAVVGIIVAKNFYETAIKNGVGNRIRV